MLLTIVLLLAAASIGPNETAAAIPDTCTSGDPKEVVVCGSREKSQRYRLPKLSPEYDRRALRAEAKIAGMPARAHVDGVGLPGGQKSKRIMLTISTAF